MDSLGVQVELDRGTGSGGPEHRVAPRYNLVIRPAKLVCSQGEFVCVIRDVSDTGVSLRTFHRLPSAVRVALELQTGDSYEMERVWETGEEAGFRFLGECDVEGVILEAGRFPKRRLRLRLALPVSVSSISGRTEAMIENLSQQGAMIDCDQSFARDQTIRLKGPGIAEIAAKVRWRDKSRHGLVFENTFDLRDFARIAALLQAPGLLASNL